jgi:hypothetical protein
MYIVLLDNIIFIIKIIILIIYFSILMKFVILLRWLVWVKVLPKPTQFHLYPRWLNRANIFEYFHYLRNLVEIHDNDNYDNWNYWQDVFADFISSFDEKNPYYDGNFEIVVLDQKV